MQIYTFSTPLRTNPKISFSRTQTRSVEGSSGVTPLSPVDLKVLKALGEQQALRQKKWDDSNFIFKGAIYYHYEDGNTSQIMVRSEVLTCALAFPEYQITHEQAQASLEKLMKADLVEFHFSNNEQLAGLPPKAFYRLTEKGQERYEEIKS